MQGAIPSENWAQGQGPNAPALGASSDPYRHLQILLAAKQPGFAGAVDADTFAMPAGVAQRSAQLLETGPAPQRRVFVQRLFK